jgi:hypothetical protein
MNGGGEGGNTSNLLLTSGFLGEAWHAKNAKSSKGFPDFKKPQHSARWIHRRHPSRSRAIHRRHPSRSRAPREAAAAVVTPRRASSAARAGTGRATARRPGRSGCRSSPGSFLSKPQRKEVVGKVGTIRRMGRMGRRPSRRLPRRRVPRSPSSRCVYAYDDGEGEER